MQTNGMKTATGKRTEQTGVSLITCSRRLTIAFILCCIFLFPHVSAEAAPDKALTEVTAVIPFDSPPTYFQDTKTGQPAGFSVEVMNRVAERAGLEVNYVFAKSWTEIMEMIKDGRAAVAPGMGMSDERAKALAFSSPIDAFSIVKFVRASNNTITELKAGHTAGGVKGSVSIELLNKISGVKVVTFGSFSEGMLALLSGEIDAFCCPEPTLLRLARDAGLENRIKTVGKPLAELKRSIAVRKDNEELLLRLNDGLNGFVGSPEYQSIYMKWYGSQKSYWTARQTAGAAAAVIVSVIVLMALWRFFSLERINKELKTEVARRTAAEKELKLNMDSLEDQVRERTAELEEEALIRKQAEAENLFAKEEWERTFDAVSDPIMILDTDHHMRRINKSMAGMIGLSVEEAAGKLCHEYMHKSSEPFSICPQCMLLKDHKEHTVEFYEPVLDKYLMVSVYPIFDAAGSLTGSVHYAKDITERKRTEEELAKNEEEFRLIFENAKDAIFWADPANGLIIRCNRAAEALLEKDRSEIIGSHQATLHPQELAEYHRQLFMKHTKQGGMDIEAEVMTKSGNRVPVQITSTTTFISGRPIIQGIFRNLTERKQTEEALGLSREHYKSLYDNNPLMLLTVDTEGTVVSVNRAGLETLGYAEQELIGIPVVNVFHEDDRAGVLHRFKEYLKEPQQIARWEFRKRRKDGSILWGYETVQMLRASGSKSSVLIVCEDVTERRRVEEEIKTYHARLEAEVRSRTIELEKKNIELERMNKMFVGRELRMAELKKQIAGLEDRKVEDANEK